MECDNSSLAYKRFCFAAKHGSTESSKLLLKGSTGGYINKENYAATLRAYKAAYDKTMSPHRKFASKINAERTIQIFV